MTWEEMIVYYLLGSQENLKTVGMVLKNFLKKDPAQTSFGDMKVAYAAFARHIQPEIPPSTHSNQVNYVVDDELLDSLINIFVDSNSNEKTISGFSFEK